MSENNKNFIQNKIQEDISPTKSLKGFHLKIVASIAILWSFFQLWYASPFPFILDFGVIKGLPAKALHLGFALILAFLIFPFQKNKKLSWFDFLIAILSALSCFYIVVFYDD